MDFKRKHSASYDHTRKKSKKSNTGTENTIGTSSADDQRASMSAIELNLANLQEQVSGLPSELSDNYYAVSQDVIDLTLTTSSSQSDGPRENSSDSEQDNGDNYENNCSRDDEAMEDRSSMLGACSCVGDSQNLYDESRTAADNTHKNKFLYTDNTTFSECSTAVSTRVSLLNNGHDYYKTTNSRSESTTYSYKTNCFGCSCVVIKKNYSDDGAQTANNIGATEHINTTFQCGEDELNAITSEWSTASTSVGQRDNGQYEYYKKHNTENVNGTESSTENLIRGSTLITSIREQEDGCFVYLTEYDEAMNEIRSNVYSIEKPTTPILNKPMPSFVVMSL